MNEGVDTSAYPNTQEVRDWAAGRSSGGSIQRTGRLPRAVISGWNKTHPERPFVSGQSFHGTRRGYSEQSCRCDRCLTAGRQVARNDYRYARDQS